VAFSAGVGYKKIFNNNLLSCDVDAWNLMLKRMSPVA